MKLKTRIAVLFSLATCAATAQVMPFGSGKASLSHNSLSTTVASAGSTATISFTADPASAGGDTLDVVTVDPGVVVTLIIPGGTEITAANAASQGFGYATSPDGSASDAEVPSFYTLPGSHTLFTFPASAPAGSYTIKADATGAAQYGGVLAAYTSSSAVVAGLVTDAPVYRVGDTVVLSGFVFDGTTPVTNAAVTASVSAPISLSGQAAIGGYSLISSVAADAGQTHYTYTASVTNTTAQTLRTVMADTGPLPTSVGLADGGTLLFGDIAAGATAVSTNTFTISRDPNLAFNPTSLTWNVTTPGPPSQVTLVDSGTFDAATGDGIYTGTFVPTVAGDYTAIVSVTGNSSHNVAFARSAGATFRVSQPLGSFGQFQEATFDDDLNGLFNGLAITANVTIQVPGSYRFFLQLAATNGKTISQTTTASSRPERSRSR
jgi:hypothetical protein